MSDPYLLIPMQLDIMVLNQEASAATPFLRFQMEYENLQSFTSPEPEPFAGGTTQPPGAGIYLHWTLPRDLRHGTHQEDGSTDFPLVPNRWLVVRVQGGATAAQAVKAWILESDYCADCADPTTPATSPFVNPYALDSNGIPQPTCLGRAIPFTPALTSLPVQAQPFLRAVGPGSVTFATFSPGVQNVFAFYDDVSDASGTPIDAATFSYYVAGWFSSPTYDPLGGTTWSPNPDVAGTYANDTFEWYVYAASATLPQQMLVHSLVSSVPWDRCADNPPAANYPTDIANTVKVAVANTAIDALSALVRLDRNNQTEADLLEAFQYNLLDQFDLPGSSELLNIAIRQHWFGASPGGTLWTVVAQERVDSTALPVPPVPALTSPQQQALAALNTAQDELDRQGRVLEAMQWVLFSLWWKNQWQLYNNPPVDGDFSTWLTTQLPVQLQGATSCNVPNGTDPSKESIYACKVLAQQNLVSTLTTQAQNAQSAVQGLINPDTQELKAINAPQFYYPNDPVVLITGLGRATNFDPGGSLLCRLSSQTVTALTVGGTSYCSGSASCAQNIQAQLPVLADPHNLLPDGVQQLNVENFFLSPELFAQDILGNVNLADAVRRAIAALPAPPVAELAPPGFAMAEWAQPWVPLLLDWSVTVLQQPAYSCGTNQPTCTFDQSNWQFDGTDYGWVGPTTPGGGNFDEADSGQMALKGRTFVTPQIAFTLADQLDAYVKNHTMRDPNLEALLQDLDTYIDGFRNQDILSQRLSGLLGLMIQRTYEQSVPPTGAIAGQLGTAIHGYPDPFPDEHSSEAAAVWDFAPLRGTFFVITGLTVIDTFGRTVDLQLANYSTDPLTKGSVAEYYFYPIAGRDLTSPTGLNPKPGQGQSSDPTQRMLQLGPRMIRDSRLALQLISNDGQNNNIDQAAGANPICGWVIPNHLDRSLAFYDPDGNAWGELYLSLHSGGTYMPVWQPDPTNPDAPQSVAAIPNTFVSTLLQTLAARADDGSAFSDLIQVIDETLWTINPRGQRKDQNLSVLVGRPLVIVRVALSLQIRGLAPSNQDWWNLFAVDPQHLPDPTQPVPLVTVDGGMASDLWSVRLGSQALRHDGVIGYYVDDPNTPANAFAVFNTVNLPAGVQTDYLKQIGPGNYLPLRFIDDTVAAPDPKQNQISYLTVLMDPRGSIDAFTGLLPVVTLDIPDQFIKPALQKMYYLFRAGPVLTSPEELRIPRPAARRGRWSWFDRVLNAATPVAPADGNVRFPATPPLVKEGWLKFQPNPPLPPPPQDEER